MRDHSKATRARRRTEILFFVSFRAVSFFLGPATNSEFQRNTEDHNVYGNGNTTGSGAPGAPQIFSQ